MACRESILPIGIDAAVRHQRIVTALMVAMPQDNSPLPTTSVDPDEVRWNS